MDGIANVARQQQSQIKPSEMQEKANTQVNIQTNIQQQQTKTKDLIQEAQEAQDADDIKNISQEDVNELIKKLNQAMSPLNTDIKFGVDQNDIFYVAAIDTKTHKVIRRFPAEQAQDFLPKMQEVTGILFDSKG